jgi:chromosomal replication initiation ATPase DnaA
MTYFSAPGIKLELTIENIKNIVYGFYNIPPEMALSTSRKRDIIEPKQVTHYLSKELTKERLTDIGFNVGMVDHATVLNSIKRIHNYCETDKIFKIKIENIRKMLTI